MIAAIVAERHPAIVELAQRYPTEKQLVDYIRSLPQRDDTGDLDDGPRLHACSPPQRMRIGTGDLNCFERAATYAAVADLLRPEHAYQLATVDTDVGLHTFPLKDGRPVVLDPRITSDCLDCGIALSQPGPIGISPRNAINWTIDFARRASPQVRNGPSQLYVGKNAIRRLVDEGAVPAPREVDAIGFLFAIAERAAQRYGSRALMIVRTTARAIADVLDGVLARRNAHLDLAGIKLDTPRWLDDSAGALGNVGLNVGSVVLRKELDGLDLPAMIGLPGATQGILGLFEDELGQKGRTLGAVAHPPELATFAQLAAPRVATLHAA